MKTILILLASAILHSTAYPATILQEQSQFAGIFNAPAFKGQTFIAEDPLLRSIGVSLLALGPSQPDTTVNLTLFAGRGVSGPVLAQRTSKPLGGAQWLDFDVTGVPVEPGELYTFIIQSPTRYWGAHYNQWSYPNGTVDEFFEDRVDYVGGEFFNERGFYPYVDLTFRVVPIPEPGTALMLLAGLAGLWFVRRLKS